jgi:hypothetical protein
VLVRTDGPHEDAGQRSEHLVSDGVAARVVHGLEAVDVQQGDGDEGLARFGEHLLEMLVEGAAVQEASEGVTPRLGKRQREASLLRE